MSKNAQRALELLRLAFNNTRDDHSLLEVRRHIWQAMTKLENAVKKDSEPKTSRTREWWDRIVAGTTTSKITPSAAVRSLRELDAMISAEQRKIEELEKNSGGHTDDSNLLQD